MLVRTTCFGKLSYLLRRQSPPLNQRVGGEALIIEGGVLLGNYHAQGDSDCPPTLYRPYRYGELTGQDNGIKVQ